MTATFTVSDSTNQAGENLAWSLLLAARSLLDDGGHRHGTGLRLDWTNGTVTQLRDNDVTADLVLHQDGQWQYAPCLPSIVRHLLDLYLPVLTSANRSSQIVGHLGQSIDARIATVDGDAFFVTGEENRKHLHRMRALSHAVIVGAGTVVADNPQLTTRSVTGASPVRVVIDPGARVSTSTGMLNDGEAQTLLLHSRTLCPNKLPDGSAFERIQLPDSHGRFDLSDVVSVLAERGLHRLFVEGGGVTVSRFLKAGCLDRLHIATAPVLVGDGRPALQLPAAVTMQSAYRPSHKLYRMGRDVLWDFDMRDMRCTSSSDSQNLDDDDQPVSFERLL